MPEVLKFISVGDGKFRVEIWGDALLDYGVMHVDDMIPFLQNLKIIAATPEEVVQWLRDGNLDGDSVFIEKRKNPSSPLRFR
jgi:hypothetical protein